MLVMVIERFKTGATESIADRVAPGLGFAAVREETELFGRGLYIARRTPA